MADTSLLILSKSPKEGATYAKSVAQGSAYAQYIVKSLIPLISPPK